MKAIIEMPEGTKNKVECKANGHFVIDRVLDIPVPLNYGFVPNTLAEDNDPLDIFVISDFTHLTGDTVEVDILGIFECTDQGVSDNKLLAKKKDQKLTHEQILSYMCRVGHYLLNYKEGFKVLNYKSTDESIVERYLK